MLRGFQEPIRGIRCLESIRELFVHALIHREEGSPSLQIAAAIAARPEACGTEALSETT